MTPCATCRRGCGCAHPDPGCGHYGCYGRGPVDCPGAEAEEARYSTILARQRADSLARHLRRLRLAASHRALAASYRLPMLP